MDTTDKSRFIDIGDGVSVEIVKEKDNRLIGRRELSVFIHHVGKGTPAIPVLRTKLSQKLDVNIGCIYIRKLQTEYGIGRSLGIVHIYDSPNKARSFEPEYIIDRNKTLEEEVAEAK